MILLKVGWFVWLMCYEDCNGFVIVVIIFMVIGCWFVVIVVFWIVCSG